MRALSYAYLVAIFAFIFLPVVVLVLFSFQAGRLPVPPFDGPSLKWYAEVLANRGLMEALRNSLFVALISSSIALTLGFQSSCAVC
jgi:spermidine/putrescine transport system permease protein